MTARVSTVALVGIAATSVDVQVQLTAGNPAFSIVGLPNNAVKESKERVRGAFHALGLRTPAKHIVVNLAPADQFKNGSHYDLPIAVALLMAMGLVPGDAGERAMFLGELALDGRILPVPGCLPAGIYAVGEGCAQLYVPAANAAEAAWAGALDVFGVPDLRALIRHLKNDSALTPTAPTRANVTHSTHLDMADIKGQETAKRAAEIAAAGGHNLLLSGPPGSGKSMLAARLPGLLPPLTPMEALDVSMIHSVAGALPTTGLITQRPYRDPHHSASSVALTGGGLKAQPGEMSLSHRGVLFLDELPEFPRAVLETLRQPLETGAITISRANKHVTYPARFQLVAAMNPCPCGYLGDSKRQCKKAPQCGSDYQAKLSGPLLDRIDLHVAVPPVKVEALAQLPSGESTAVVAARVARAREVQQQRYQGAYACNGELGGQALERHCQLDAESQKLLHTAAERFGLSARAYHRVLKVARTIADLAMEMTIRRPHVAEALHYRQF